MPEWLLNTDKYNPPKHKDTFINKSILSLLGIFSKLVLQTDRNKGSYKINAVVKVITSLIFIILVSISRSFAFILAVNIFLLFFISMLEADEIKDILGIGIMVAAFTAIILVPSMLWGNIRNSILIILRVLACVTSVNVLSHITQWNDITSTLRLFFIPDLFIFVLDITIKYIIILGEFSLNMLYALRLRSVGRSRSKYTSLSGIMGTMFIKSKEMAEEMQSAMECRGFTGEYKVHIKHKINLFDFLCACFDIFIIWLYLYLR